MNNRRIYLYSGLVSLVFITWIFLDSGEGNNAKSEIVKIAMREVGHKLLLANQDSTSLVLPITEIEESKYKISFQNDLSIVPDSLVAIVKKSFKKATLSEFYIVEVIQCSDDEVAYSYKMRNEKDKSIIPCKGRYLPKNCYTIEAQLLNRTKFLFNKSSLLFVLGLIVILILLDIYIYTNRQDLNSNKIIQEHYSLIGRFRFYPDQNKLVKEDVEINLSKKECDLLSIFIANRNQVVKREDLTKKVWEDNGVFVGRSLDTYISKLRKKLRDDDSVKLVNVHGIGYKLEID